MLAQSWESYFRPPVRLSHASSTRGAVTYFGCGGIYYMGFVYNELFQRLVRYCSVEDATLEGAVCCRC